MKTIHDRIDCNSKNLIYTDDTLSTMQQTVHRWNEKTTEQQADDQQIDPRRPPDPLQFQIISFRQSFT